MKAYRTAGEGGRVTSGCLRLAAFVGGWRCLGLMPWSPVVVPIPRYLGIHAMYYVLCPYTSHSRAAKHLVVAAPPSLPGHGDMAIALELPVFVPPVVSPWARKLKAPSQPKSLPAANSLPVRQRWGCASLAMLLLLLLLMLALLLCLVLVHPCVARPCPSPPDQNNATTSSLSTTRVLSSSIASRLTTSATMADRDEKIVETNDPVVHQDEKVATSNHQHDEKIDAKTDPAAGTRRNSSVVADIAVHNPLKRQSVETVATDAATFAEANGMADKVTLFTKAALVARDPENFESLSELAEDERAALIYEREHIWHGSKMLWYSIGLCAVGAATQGWDQTGSNGANLGFPQEFGLDKRGIEGRWIIGLINAIIFLTAGLIGAWIVDPLNHYLGRRGEIFVTALCLTATPIGSGFARTWQELFAARFVMGIGIGAKNATVPIFSAEMAPARIRGALVMFWQLWVVTGIFLGFCANVIVKDVGDIAWRLELGSAFIPSFILGAGIWFCPESPRWLMKHGKIAQGFHSMDRLRAHPIIAARDYYYSYIIYTEEMKVAGGQGYFRRMADCFTVPRIRRSNYGASTVMLAQQMCGINIISFYSSSIFTEAGFSKDQALFASLGYGALQMVFTVPTLFLIDTKGRRTLTLLTFPFMCIFLLAAGLCTLTYDEIPAEMLTASQASARVGPIVLFIYLFTIAYSLGEGPVAFQYSAEVFPTIQREQGMAWAVFINNTFAGVLSLTFPPMVDAMSQVGAFSFYAGLNLIAWGMIFCFVRETKQLTLEELDQVFSVPTRQFLNYETKTWLPYFFKRHILRKPIEKPPPMIETAPRPEQVGKA
ncbi:unnamed protein product [Periconia digitata]|uniref:Major facilitator superfamily (MFS) profile domain-containing protein n=1 Tax=Periconia digitata TaxID=1303443 RepID=A0A9W4U451_9PLEO|nr:unnamed protein product [Periconia digitata]